MRAFIQETAPTGKSRYSPRRAAASFNKTVQATPTSVAVRSLRSWDGLCHRYGVPDLFRSMQGVRLQNQSKIGPLDDFGVLSA
jgi:hypothetical protein